MGIDQVIDRAMRPFADAIYDFVFYAVPLGGGVEMPLIVAWLIAGGLFFTLYLGFINVRGFKHSLALVSGRYSDPNHAGEVSHFQALATAVSGTVGIGNIGSVAVAVSVGGPGATFWMIIAGLLGMSTKFAECTLAVKFRREHDDGSVSGGPMYFLRRGLALRGLPRTGKVLGVFYAAAMVVGCLGIGNMFQSNQAVAILIDVTGGSESFFADRAWLLGLLMAMVVALVIVGGIKSIARTTSKLVPFMAALYILMALTVLALNLEKLPASFGYIWHGAFSPESIGGGLIGTMIIGFRRAVFSNEAGLGSAAIAHSAVRTDEPVTEGFVALLEPFIDTVVICTLTSLVIVTTVYDPALATSEVSGIELTAGAFASTLSWSPVPLSVAAVLFAFSTLISWSYYGLKAFTYLAGRRKAVEVGFRLFYCSFIVLGSSIQLGALIDLSDALIYVVAIPNLMGLYLLAPVLKEELLSYRERLARF
ncbi:alanine/glycine:cation symporter family protein [Gemmatimonadota bacterium]